MGAGVGDRRAEDLDDLRRVRGLAVRAVPDRAAIIQASRAVRFFSCPPGSRACRSGRSPTCSAPASSARSSSTLPGPRRTWSSAPRVTAGRWPWRRWAWSAAPCSCRSSSGSSGRRSTCWNWPATGPAPGACAGAGGLGHRLVDAWIAVRLMRVTALRTIGELVAGRAPGAQAATAKLYASVQHQRLLELATELLAEEATVTGDGYALGLVAAAADQPDGGVDEQVLTALVADAVPGGHHAPLTGARGARLRSPRPPRGWCPRHRRAA